jgi:hypothetical protein
MPEMKVKPDEELESIVRKESKVYLHSNTTHTGDNIP